MTRRLSALVLILALPAVATAVNVPVAGERLELRAREGQLRKRSAQLVAVDGAIAAPLPDPTLGAALIVNAGVQAGQCRVEIPLDPAKWQAIGGDGPNRGYRYRAKAPGTQGVRRIVLRRGRIDIKARGADWPCDLAAAAQRLPVSVVLRVGTTRYCAAFGDPTERNEAGRLAVRDAPAPGECPETDLTVANLNILHGLFCFGSANCRLSNRIDLLFQWIAASGCPDLVAFQEVWDPALPFINAKLAGTCPFPYQSIYVPASMVDDEMILTRYPVVTFESHGLVGDFRRVLFARIDHPIGPVDVFVTHLASGSDGAQNPCEAPDCPAECLTAGAATVRQCQGVQMANFIEARHDVSTPAIALGDFNESPGTFVYDQFAGRGWIDTYLAAGNPECDPGTGIGCTAGRIDNNLSHLQSPASNEVERIDYIFLVPPGPGSLCTAAIEPAGDGDGDGTATRIFSDDPNPFAPTCGPLPDPICWPSDHEGNELDLECG